MVAHPRRALGQAVGLLIGAAVIGLLVGLDPNRGFVQGLDDAFGREMLRLRVGWVVALARACTNIGGSVIGGLLRGLVAVVLVYRRWWRQLAAFGLTLATSEFVVTVWKELSARPRPPSGLVATASWAFPSGHAAFGASALGVVLVLVPPGPKRRKWVFAALVFAAAMALSRTYLGVHWLSDIAAGTLVGLAAATGCPALLDLVDERRLSRRTPDSSRTGS